MKITKEQLIEGHIHLVYGMVDSFLSTRKGARKYRDDFVSEGFKALVEAANRYDTSKGNKFSVYAYKSIKGSIYKYIRSNKKYEDRHLNIIDSGKNTQQFEEDIGEVTEHWDTGLFDQLEEHLSEAEMRMVNENITGTATYREIGDSLGITIKASEYLCKKVKKKIRKLIESGKITLVNKEND